MKNLNNSWGCRSKTRCTNSKAFANAKSQYWSSASLPSLHRLKHLKPRPFSHFHSTKRTPCSTSGKKTNNPAGMKLPNSSFDSTIFLHMSGLKSLSLAWTAASRVLYRSQLTMQQGDTEVFSAQVLTSELPLSLSLFLFLSPSPSPLLSLSCMGTMTARVDHGHFTHFSSPCRYWPPAGKSDRWC